MTSSTTEAASSSNKISPPTPADTKEEKEEKIDLEKLAESMDEQDMIDSLEKALDEETTDQEMLQTPIPADRRAPHLAAPVEKRRRKKRNQF